MIYALPGASFEANAQYNVTGLVGTITVAVYDGIGGTTIPPTGAGIIETAPGIYTATLLAPLVAGQYVVVWNDGSFRAAEELYVTTSSAVPLTPTPGPGMDVGALLDGILLDRFETEHRPRALQALNNRYAHLWAIEDWTWRFARVPVSISAGVGFVGGLPDDFGVPLYLWDDQGSELTYLDTDSFAASYPPASPQGFPASWTVIAETIYVGPIPGVSSSAYQTYYRRRLIPLSDETQIPAIPQEFQLALVHGGRAELLAFYNDPTSSDMEQQFQMDIEALRREYLADATGQPSTWPADALSHASGGW